MADKAPTAPQTVMFGHAAGWPDDPAVPMGHSHSWTVDAKGTLIPPTEHNHGLLRRHPALLNQRQLRVLPFGPPDDLRTYRARVTPMVVRERAYTLGGGGRPGDEAALHDSWP